MSTERAPAADPEKHHSFVRSAYETGPSYHDRGPREPTSSLWEIEDHEDDDAPDVLPSHP